MQRKALTLLIVVNVVLAMLITMGPIAAQIFPKSLKKDCCVQDECLANHCWFVNDCDASGSGGCIN